VRVGGWTERVEDRDQWPTLLSTGLLPGMMTVLFDNFLQKLLRNRTLNSGND